MEEDLLSLALVQRGDTTGLVELMGRHKEAIFRFIFRYLGNEADAAELTEETFYRVYLKAGNFRPKAKVKTWMFTIAANLCRDFIRRQAKFKRHVSLNAEDGSTNKASFNEVIPGDAVDPAEDAISRESLVEIEDAIHRLPEKLKFPFIFCILEDNSYNECAEVLKTNRKTVETRIYRARKLLRASLSSL